MACRIIPFTPSGGQGLPDDAPVSRVQATVLRKALDVAFTAWADANPLDVSESKERLPIYYRGYVETAFSVSFGCASVARLPATLYPAALRWIAHVTERIEFPAWWSLSMAASRLAEHRGKRTGKRK